MTLYLDKEVRKEKMNSTSRQYSDISEILIFQYHVYLSKFSPYPSALDDK